MDDPVGEYHSALTEIEEAYKNGIKAFADWFAKNWTVTREQWIKEYAEPPPSDDWFTGYNAGVESANMALENFLGEYHS